MCMFAYVLVSLWVTVIWIFKPIRIKCSPGVMLGQIWTVENAVTHHSPLWHHKLWFLHFFNWQNEIHDVTRGLASCRSLRLKTTKAVVVLSTCRCFSSRLVPWHAVFYWDISGFSSRECALKTWSFSNHNKVVAKYIHTLTTVSLIT